jgi:hypothetical protein
MFSFGELLKIFELVYPQPNIGGGYFAKFDEGIVAANIHHFALGFKYIGGKALVAGFGF